MITSKQYETLISFESNFNTAINSNYIRAISKSNLEILMGVYKEIFNTEFRMTYNCPTCVFRLVSTLGNLFYEYKSTTPNQIEEVKIEPIEVKKERYKATVKATKKKITNKKK